MKPSQTKNKINTNELNQLFINTSRNLKVIPFVELYAVTSSFGGIWLYLFFIKLKYLPAFDFASIVSVILGVAFVGFILLVFLCIYLISPSFFLHTIWGSVYFPHKNPIADTETIIKIKRKYFLASLHQNINGLLLLILWIYYFIRHTFSYKEQTAYLAILVIIFMINLATEIATTYKTIKKLNEDLRPSPTLSSIIYSDFLLMFGWFFTWLTLFTLFINSLTDLATAEKWNEFIIILVFFVAIAIINSAVPLLTNSKEKLKFVLIGIICLFLTFANLPINNFSIINAPFRALNLGNIDHAKVLVKKETCEELSALNPMICKLSRNQDFGILNNVKIFSRIGNEFVIGDGVRKYPLRLDQPIAIKKDDVLNWIVIK